MAAVMTVTGPISSDRLGFTLVHEHIYVDLRKDYWSSDRLLNNTELAYDELMRYKNAGGVTLVDQTSGGLRGNEQRILPIKHPLAVRQVAERTGLNIILGCGWYREPYYEPHLWRAKTDEIAEEMVRDITEGTEGIEGTDVRAGIIGEIGAHGNWILPVEERVLRAAARAHNKTGLTISTHQSEGTVALDQLDILREEGVDPRRVIISHANSYPHLPSSRVPRRDRPAWRVCLVRGTWQPQRIRAAGGTWSYRRDPAERPDRSPTPFARCLCQANVRFLRRGRL